MTLDEKLTALLHGRELLTHPFYQRWERGELEMNELSAYAAQYEHVERQLPITLEASASLFPQGPRRAALEDNLADELGRPAPHLELFASFSQAVGAHPTAPTSATQHLVDVYNDAPTHGASFALGVIAAYESQAADIASSKAEGLRRWYELDDNGTRFWDVHAELETTHARWLMDAAADVDHEDFLAGAAVSRDAWWAFLDERESLNA